MGLVVAITAGLVVWIVLWATGMKGLDAFFIPLAFAIVAVTARLLAPYLPGRRS